ncbi:unnamed protein product [Sphenostylis stenocarpa]|uniref:HTH myb-type domain-containing protein n=1 Tax=Sphenostylis stenocarpa TaxID=92480 RepID=A0AA86RZL3_9FABA|nr:unnamed protein product [Sphenostylis stenocarpa]
MSSDESKVSAARAFTLGACDYWVKPLNELMFQTVWTHVYRKNFNEKMKQKDVASLKDDNEKRGMNDDTEVASSSIVEAEDVDQSKNNNTTKNKKDRVVWSTELHSAFLDAINKLGHANAVPKKILQLMNIPGLERYHVASHLQKYRKLLKPKPDRVTKRKQQNAMSLVAVNSSGNTEPPRMCACGRTQLHPLPATVLSDFHPGVTVNTVPRGEEQSDPNRQLANHFHAEQALAHDHPLPTLPNSSIHQIFQPQNDAFRHRYKLWSPSPFVRNRAMVRRDNMRHLRMHHHSICPVKFQSSPMSISENPFSQNYSFGMSTAHGLISSQSVRNSVGGVEIRGENNTGEAIQNQYTTRTSIFPKLHEEGSSSGAVRSYDASVFDPQVPNAKRHHEA